MEKKTAEQITDDWTRRSRRIEDAGDEEARYNAVRRALQALLPDEEPTLWTISPEQAQVKRRRAYEPPELLVLGGSALWTVGMSEAGLTVSRHPIDREKMRLSVLEKSAQVRGETGEHIEVVREWTLTDGAYSVVLSKTKQYDRRPATSDDEQGERFAIAVAGELGWTLPSGGE